MNTLVINTDELWLKGRKRPFYLRILRRHIRKVLQAYGINDFTISMEYQRLVVNTASVLTNEIMQALQKIAGIHSLAPVVGIKAHYEKIGPAILGQLQQLDKLPDSFRIKCHRAFKQFPMKSLQIEREMGGVVLKQYPQLQVNLKNPELLIDLKITREHIYIATNRLQGMGGLPVSSTGHVVSLLSGGIDSPVASYLLAKRGCHVTYVFFHAYPFVGDEVKEKIILLAQKLAPLQIQSHLHIVPFGNLQQYIANHCEASYRTLFFRHYMLTTASKIADNHHADALVSGDSLSQVSSQTLKNISLLDQCCNKSIFRPLIGLNKAEIIDISKQIGTYETSIMPHDDACSLLAPKQPVVKPFRKYWYEFLEAHNIDSQIEDCIQQTEIIRFDCRGNIEKPSQSKHLRENF